MQEIVSLNLSPLVAKRLKMYINHKRIDKKPKERMQEVYDQIIIAGLDSILKV